MRLFAARLWPGQDPAGYHLHLLLFDGQGRTIGGHMQPGCLIYTTAEIVVGDIETVAFSRTFDPETGYPELVVQER